MRAGTTPNGQPRSTALYEAILRLDNLDDCIRFFEDLCAVTELRTMEQRYDVAGCLLQGKVYSEIRQLTGASSAAVSRASAACQAARLSPGGALAEATRAAVGWSAAGISASFRLRSSTPSVGRGGICE